MIGQHILQQQRLNNNHERLLERHRRLLNPQISQFRTFGTSSLPGRNYEQHLHMMHGDHRQRDSLAAISRAGIGSSTETYRWIGDQGFESLPNNVSSVMQHSRQHLIPLVHAEKFEPVKVYEHPVFGPTPAYLRPVYTGRRNLERTNDHDGDDESEHDVDSDVHSHTSGNISLTGDHTDQIKSPSTNVNDDDELADNAPKGYISYKKWKSKYENLIPVNPLLFSIYTQRPNGSIDSYGQSLYAKPNHLNRYTQLTRDEEISTPIPSEIDSNASDAPHETSLPSTRPYHRLQTQFRPTAVTPRPLGPILAESDSSGDEESPPDSPVPYLSRNKPNHIIPTSFSTTVPSTSTITPSVPTSTITPSIPTTGITPLIPTTGITSTTPSTLNTSIVNSAGTSLPGLNSTSTSSIPPAPPLPSSLLTTPSTNSYQAPSTLSASSTPIAPPMPGSLSTTSSTAPYQAPSTLSISSPPIAPPMPAYSSTTSSTAANRTPSNFSTSAPPVAPPMPAYLSTTNSNAGYQTPSNNSLVTPSAPPLASSAKAVSFGTSSAIPVANADVSSSSDSDDGEKMKRKRRKKRQAAAGVGGHVDESSSDD